MASLHEDNSRPSTAKTHAYSFDSDLSPEQKKAVALKAVPAGLKTEKRNRGQEIVNDLSALPSVDMPAPSAAGLTVAQSKGLTNGSSSNGAVVGWEMAGGSNREEYAKFLVEEEIGMGHVVKQNSNIDHGSSEHQTMLEAHLPASAFGEWYHNTAVIASCALVCWVIGRLGGGLSWILIVGAFCATYYRTSIRRVRRNARDDISRALAKARLETDTETAEWMNSFLAKFWIIYEPVLSATIVASVDQVLATTTPPIVESMRLSFFTLGTKPPRIEHVKTYPKSEDDIVLMDWRFSFTPNDTDDLTARQIRNKINPKIQLAIRAGVSVASVSVPIVVEDIAFSGLMQVRIKLITEFPHIKVVDLSFLEKPEIGYVLKPLGGSSGMDIGIIPGLSGMILEMIHAQLGPMMYAPNVFTLNIQQMMSGAPIDSAIGVAVVTVHEAHGLRNTDIGSGKPDAYVSFNVGHGEIARTKTIQSNTDPRFNESKTLLLTTLKDPLALEVYDYNDVRKDKLLGTATFDLTKLEEDTEQEHVTESIMAGGKIYGSIQFSVSWFPVLTATKLDDGTFGPVPESMTGIVRFTVHQAKNLGGSKNVTPYATLLMDSKEVAKPPKMKHTHNPVWDFSKELLVHDKRRCILGVQIKNDETGTDQILGSYAIKLEDLLQNSETDIEDYLLKQSKDSASKVKITATWKPVALTGNLGANAYQAPVGAMRVEFAKALELRNPEIGITGGKADPYMRVMVNGQVRARTLTIKNTQNPEWNEIVYVPIKSSRDRVTLEVMDYQNLTKDRSLGEIVLNTSEIILQNSDGRYAEHLGAETMTKFAGLNAKGTLQYKISFHPAIRVMSKEEEEEADNSSRDSQARGSTTLAEAIPSSAMQDGAVLPMATRLSSETVGSRLTVPKVRLSVEDLMQHDSGFLVFELLEGHMPRTGCYLQVLFDDYLYPAYTTSRARSIHAKWNETGEGFIRELQASRIVLKLVEQDKSHDENDVLAEVQDDTLNVLRRSMNQICSQKLKGKTGEISEVTFRCRYIPVPLKLDPRESVNNMGTLRVTVLSGSKLCAADKGNKSDPYAKFYMGAQKDHVYKTKKVDKTLNPEWNESFEVEVYNRQDDVFRVEVFDWDAIGEDDHLGSAFIPLETLQPMEAVPLELALDGPKGGNGKSGTIKLQILFLPGFVKRARRTSTRAFTVATGVVGKPVKVVGAGLHGVKKTGGFLGRGIGLGRRGSKDEGPDIETLPDGRVVLQDGNPPLTLEDGSSIHTTQDDANAVPTPHQIKVASNTTTNTSGIRQGETSGINPETGLLSLKVLRGEQFPEKKTQIRIKGRSGHSIGKLDATKHLNPTFDASFSSNTVLPDDLVFTLHEHSTFGSDKTIATAIVSVDPSMTNNTHLVARFDNEAVLYLEVKFTHSELASIKSHRGLKISSPFRRTASQQQH